MSQRLSERAIVFLVSAVHFVNILDFMMVMPLGPDFAAALAIPNSQLGFIAGSYTAAGAVAGLIGSLFLDRFDRRRALAVAMLGLVIATASGGLATGLGTLIAARVAAGIFGAPAAALSLSIIADVVPPERRGKAMGAVMGAFAVSSVLGVPAGLELARLGGWRLPFFGVATLGLLVAAAAVFFMPPMRAHLDAAHGEEPRYAEVFSRPGALSAIGMAVAMMAGFSILVPNISAYLQYNLGYPRERLGLLYLAGGAAAFFTLRAAGRAVDRYGAFRVATVGTALFALTIYVGFAHYIAAVPIIAVFVALMMANSIRSVPTQAVSSQVPAPRERARFMSVASTVQHASAAAGAFLGPQILTELPDHSLQGIAAIAWTSIAFALLIPPLLLLTERALERRATPPPLVEPEPAK
jgi:predicted MFS family arabinose efflux permease